MRRYRHRLRVLRVPQINLTLFLSKSDFSLGKIC